MSLVASTISFPASAAACSPTSSATATAGTARTTTPAPSNAASSAATRAEVSPATSSALPSREPKTTLCPPRASARPSVPPTLPVPATAMRSGSVMSPPGVLRAAARPRAGREQRPGADCSRRPATAARRMPRASAKLHRVIDLLLRNAVLPRSTAPVDLGVDGGVLVDPVGQEARETVDLGGRLVTPPLVEPHIHLDAVLTVGQPRQNVTGSLFEGIAIWAERVKDLSVDDVKDRVRKVLRWQLANGVQHVRSHVDVCDPELTALRALAELREEVRGIVDLQLVAFPQQGILGFPDGKQLMEKACDLGADVVGGIPHYELTREDGVESVRFLMALADERGLLVDVHCDETDDDHSRFVEVMAAETIRRGMAGRVTASHTTAMHSYNAAYAYRLINNLARSGMHFVTNPLDNSVLQGRFDQGPVRRGHTRVKQLQEAGLTVCIGHDSVMDPWYPLGYGDPLQAAFVLAHYGQMSGYTELQTLIDMITRNPAGALGLEGYGLEPGCRADLVAFAAPTEMDAIRLVAPRKLVLRGGKMVAKTEPSHTTVVWDGREEEVDFLKPAR